MILGRLINLTQITYLVVINHRRVVINLCVYIGALLGFVKGLFGFKNKGILCWYFDWGINFGKYVHFLSLKLKNFYCFLGARKWNEMCFGFLILKSKFLYAVVVAFKRSSWSPLLSILFTEEGCKGMWCIRPEWLSPDL